VAPLDQEGQGRVIDYWWPEKCLNVVLARLRPVKVDVGCIATDVVDFRVVKYQPPVSALIKGIITRSDLPIGVRGCFSYHPKSGWIVFGLHHILPTCAEHRNGNRATCRLAPIWNPRIRTKA